MRKHNNRGLSVFRMVFGLVTLPVHFIAGLLTGVIVPLAAVSAVIALIHLFTGKFLFLGPIAREEGGERTLELRLVAPDQIRDRLAEYRERFREAFGQVRIEIQVGQGSGEGEETTEL